MPPDSAALPLDEITKSLLRSVENGDVTWRRHNRTGRPSFRLWTDERNYNVITKEIAHLVEQGFIQCERAAGHRFAHFGPVDLTSDGWRALDG